jgi:AraC family transcriptional regulator
MLWSERFDKEHEPTGSQIAEYIATPLWGELADHLQQAYNSKPKIEYSGCSMDGGIWKGWNVKYKKGGKSLCTLYPKRGYFLSLITVSEKDAEEADLLIQHFCDYVKELYHRAVFGKNYGKMLGIEVTSEEILQDMKVLIALRAGTCNRRGVMVQYGTETERIGENSI